jgi:membrane fusion protein (multidrug efflux system)
MNNGSLARSSRAKAGNPEGSLNVATGPQPIAAVQPGTATVLDARPAAATAAVEPALVAEQPAPKKRRRTLLVALAAVVALGGGTYVWSKRFIESTDDAQVDAELVGVAARSGGTVSGVYFADNQIVHRGELLAEIDAAPAKAKLAQAAANLAAAEAAAHAADVQVQLASRNAQTDLALASAGVRSSSLGAESTQSSIAQARAGVDNARARLKEAEQNLARTMRLYEQGAASDAQRDAVQSAHDVAATELARAEAALANVEVSRDLARSKIAEAQAKLSQSDQVEALTREAQARAEQAHAAIATAEAAKALAELDLSYTKIFAPSDGVVSKKNLSVGQQIATGQNVVQLVPAARWVTANFKETQLDRMRVGQPVEIRIDAYPGRKLQGRIESFSGATGARFALLPPDNASGNFTKVVQRVGVRVHVAQTPDGIDLRPGMSAVVDVDTHAQAAMRADAVASHTPGV